MLRESIDALKIRAGGVYVDGTLGGGGHSEEILKLLGDEGRLIAIDRDARAIQRASERLRSYCDKAILVQDNFRNLRYILESLNITTVSGMLFDFGVSTPQLDEAERGFSYMTDAPLDMRMDESGELTAEIIVNTWSEQEIWRILREYGEERFAGRIARAIVNTRENSPIKTTLELVDVIRGAMPAAALREKQHPAKRSFQGIRIAVNDELGAISEMIDDAADYLEMGGRIAMITFHSLEDRLAKRGIAARENGCKCPRDFPVCICGFKQTLKSVSRKPIAPSEEEVSENPRARSAKLRVAERV